MFAKLYQKVARIYPTLHVSILTLFLSLILTSFIIAILFLYYKTYRAVSELAKNRMEFVSRDMLYRVNDLFTGSKRLVEITAGLLSDPALIHAKNPWLRSYMLHVAANYPDTTYLFIGLESGDYLEVGNLRGSVQTQYITDPKTPLPKEAVYEWQYMEQPRAGSPVKEEIFYYDASFKQVAQERSEDPYDPRTRPWYLEAKQAGKFHWTRPYVGYDTGDFGVTATLPLVDQKGAFVGVLASDLSLRLLSDFFLAQRFAKTGKVFLLNEAGVPIAPSAAHLEKANLSSPVIDTMFKKFSSQQQTTFEFRYEGVRYLAYMDRFPIETGEKWFIGILVPFQEIFGQIESAHLQVMFLILGICVIASVLVFYFAKRLSAPIHFLAADVDHIRLLDLKGEERVHSQILEISLMDASIHAMKVAFRSFVRYVPKEIVKQLLLQNKEIALGGEKKEITIFFSDIADFTAITEEQPIDVLMPLLSEYFDGMSKVILRHQGTIDKYMGDGIMAFWGAPLDMPDHAIACAKAALECRDFVKEFNNRNQQAGKPLFHTRFGINTGDVIVGNVGTSERMNYTLIGDPVNSAARLQGTNKIYHTQILISEETREQLGDQFLVRPLDIVEVKGKKQKLTIYELRAQMDMATSKEIELCQRFHRAFDAFQKQQFTEAKRQFEALVQSFPDDFPSKLYVERHKGLL